MNHPRRSLVFSPKRGILHFTGKIEKMEEM